jgi:Na+-transporting methylmalonyl-CoA/oxaloacetate decarboxylase gamma subunit
MPKRQAEETAQKEERQSTDEPQPTEVPEAQEEADPVAEERERVLAIVRAVLLNPRIPDSLIHAWEKIQEAVKARA